MSRRYPAVVVTGREAQEMLCAVGAGMDLEQAVANGLVGRTKISGRWLYFSSEDAFAVAEADVREAADRIVASWFVAPASWLPGIITNQRMVDGSVSRSATKLLLLRAIRERRFGVMALLTREFLPYLALFLHEDFGHVQEQLAVVEKVLQEHGRAGSSDLPPPARTTANDGWRLRILQHAEFLGLGTMSGSFLIGWDRS